MTDTATPTTVGAFRECPHGKSIAYRAVLEATGPTVVTRLVDIGYRTGHLVASKPIDDRSIGCLDLFNANDDIIGDHGIPHEPAWHWWTQTAELRPSQSDCALCAPDAFRATYHHPIQED